MKDTMNNANNVATFAEGISKLAFDGGYDFNEILNGLVLSCAAFLMDMNAEITNENDLNVDVENVWNSVGDFQSHLRNAVQYGLERVNEA